MVSVSGLIWSNNTLIALFVALRPKLCISFYKPPMGEFIRAALQNYRDKAVNSLGNVSLYEESFSYLCSH